jgi:uncharacterized protein (TIGR02265 family)
MRGLYLNSMERLIERLGKGDEYRNYFSGESFATIRWYPLRDYMVRLALAGAVLNGPEHVHEGMRKIARTNAATFTDSLLGRTMLRLLSHDPVRITEQALAARRQTCQWGTWKIVRHGPSQIEMVYKDEYLWIESYQEGGAEGTYEACGVKAKIETALVDRFNGSTMISW